MPKFLHAADLHLDSPMTGIAKFDRMPDVLLGATRRALENMVELALREKVDFVVVAGDLYDGDWTDYKPGIFFGQEMQKLANAGVPVFLIAGNHDAAHTMTRSLPLPSGVVRLSHEQPETKILDDFGAAIHGQSFAMKAVVENLACRYPKPIREMFNIGLLHTCVGGAEGHEPYAPCELAELVTHGYQYWALGHIHKREILHRDPFVVFPGNTQGRHARELGEKGCMIVQYDASFRVQVAFHRLGKIEWRKETVDVADVADPESILERIIEKLNEVDREVASPTVVRVEVIGRTSAHATLQADLDRWVSAVRSQTPQQLMLEKVKFQTCDLEGPSSGDDGAEGLLSVLLNDIAHDAIKEDVRLKLAEFRRRLVGVGVREEEFDPDGDAWLDEVLGEARALVIQQLTAGSL